jgi:hypothetical protein
MLAVLGTFPNFGFKQIKGSLKKHKAAVTERLSGL